MTVLIYKSLRREVFRKVLQGRGYKKIQISVHGEYREHKEINTLNNEKSIKYGEWGVASPL